MSWRVEKGNGIWLPEIDWHLDARKPVTRSFVSHAHFDHMGRHETILCSKPTAALIQDRLPGERDWRVYDFGERFALESGIEACLYPAGHIVGSSMLWLEKDGNSLLYSGDFKLTSGSTAEACQPVPADTLIVETTYGIPRYTFPTESEVVAEIVRFCRETLENDETPVLFGYSLGKSQELLRCLADSGLKAMLHPHSLKLTQTCETLGWEFPPYSEYTEEGQPGHVIICPPTARNSAWFKRIRNPKTAMISGWAIDPSATYRFQCDKAFPLSDHADYLDLQSFVAKVNPKVVYTMHGFAQEFAATLREQGYEAWALGEENQLDLSISTGDERPKSKQAEIAPIDESLAECPVDRFAKLASIAKELGGTDSLKSRAQLLDTYFATMTPEDVGIAALFLTGNALPLSGGKSLDVDWTLIKQSVLHASGSSETDFKSLYQNSRDNLAVAQKLLSGIAKPSEDTLRTVFSFLKGLERAPNLAFRQSFISEKFRKLSAEESGLLIKLLRGDLRIGLVESQVEAAIAARFDLDTRMIAKAHIRSRNLLEVVRSAAAGAMDSIQLRAFQPARFMKPRKEVALAEASKRFGETLWVENSHDGIRCQIHKEGEHIELFDGELARMTHLFPELVEAARQIPQNFICDGIVIPWRYEQALPFCELEKRLNRKGEDLFLGEEVPVLLWLYDTLWHEGSDLLDETLETRRARLDTFSVNAKIRITPVSQLSAVDELTSKLDSAREAGCRGLIVKDSQSAYEAGQTSESWIEIV